MSDFAVEITNVGKRFMRNNERRNSIKERIVRGQGKRAEEFWAVKDVSLNIPKGSVYGLIGHNGSGKSTLLKMIGGIYRPTLGTITSQGRIASLIELGAGFHPEMTGRENIGLNGSILGLRRKEISEVTDEIIDFSGLREFIDDPVKHYSSGMYVRLGFAVAVHMKPDVLLVDEVLAVGDEEFQRKCFDHLYSLRKAGKTIIVVSHGLGQLEALCDEVAWLERGTLQEIGEPTDVVASYLKRVNAEESLKNPLAEAKREETDHQGGLQSALRLTSVELTTSEGNALNHTETGTTFTFKIGMTLSDTVLGPNVRVALQHETGPLVTMIGNHKLGFDFSYVSAGNRVVEIDLLNNPLLPGRYRVHVDVFDHTGAKLLDSWNDAAEFPVRSASGEIGQGFVQLQAEYRLK